MLYGTPQAGNNPNATLNITSLEPGATLVLLDGTEMVATGSASISFTLAYHEAGGFPLTFNLSGCSAGTTIDIQVASLDLAGQYSSLPGPTGAVPTITPDANGNGYFTDTGVSPLRRGLIANYASADKPVLTVSR